MQEVLHYLELKNQYYEKFYHITLKFIDQVNQNKWDDVDYMVDSRDRILNIINSFDHKIATHIRELKLTDEETERYRARVKELIAARQEVAEKIFAADLELIGRIDDVKTETIRELKQTVENSNRINAFAGSPSPRTKPRKEV